MKKIIKKLDELSIIDCINLISKNTKEFNYFQNLGWSNNQFINQINKNINFSLGLIILKKLAGFILGDLFSIENKLEYEILLLYIDKKFRNKGNATLLLNSIIYTNFEYPLKKIILEVGETNVSALRLYEKNKFNRIGLRKDYYMLKNNHKDNAIVYERILND